VHGVAGFLEDLAQELAQLAVVLDEEDVLRHARARLERQA
jgi:hypothetical protein